MKLMMCLVFFLFILVMEAYLLFWNRKALAKRHRCCKKTTGKVIAVQHKHFSGPDEDNRYDYAFQVQYNVGGVNYIASDTAGYAYVGKKRKIYYNPSNPQDCEIGGAFLIGIWVTNIAMLLFALFMVVVIVYLIF